jgi:hypothetical protein
MTPAGWADIGQLLPPGGCCASWVSYWFASRFEHKVSASCVHGYGWMGGADRGCMGVDSETSLSEPPTQVG